MTLLRKCLLLGTVAAFALALPVLASAQDDPVFNEFRLDQSGSDDSEYIELAGPAGLSLDGLYIVIVGDGTDAGVGGAVEGIVDLAGQSIAADGLFLIAEATFGSGSLGLTGTVDFVADLNMENSDNVTYLLVNGLNSAINTGGGFGGSDLDADDDGVIDATGDYDGDLVDDGAPFVFIVDCIAAIETPGSGDLTYCGTTVGPDATFVPAHAYLCDGTWLIGPFGGGEDTPSDPNDCAVPVEKSTWGKIKSQYGTIED